jgi:aldehyde dehydrogenase (NAD+)
VTPAVVLRLAELALEAGIPEGVFSVVIGGRETGLALAGHPLIGKLAFTGSVDAGRAIAAAAGERLVGVTLELGGKSPNIVFADADVDRAEAGVLNGIFAAAGQTCVAGSRCYVEKGLFDEFLARLKRSAEGIRVGDPLDPQSHVGPIATEPQFRKDISLVDQARGEGAEVVTGGHPLQPGGEAGGYYYAPTILVPRDPATAILRTEVFGPVLSIMPFSGEDELIAMANDSPFGLAAGVWTRDISRAHRMARRLEAGTVWINMYRAFKVLSPMGGHKQSGIGHQNGPDAMDQYLKTKSVWVDTAEAFMDPMA